MIVLYIILTIVALLLIVLLVNTAVKCSKARKLTPFGAEIRDGKMWGRGTVDTKTPLFAEFSALEELLENGFEPPCNVYIGSSHNEELGGDGIPTALKYFRKTIFVLRLFLTRAAQLLSLLSAV